jgi:hypothetical protein
MRAVFTSEWRWHRSSGPMPGWNATAEWSSAMPKRHSAIRPLLESIWSTWWISRLLKKGARGLVGCVNHFWPEDGGRGESCGAPTIGRESCSAMRRSGLGETARTILSIADEALAMLEGEFAALYARNCRLSIAPVLTQPWVRKLLSSEHLWGGGTLIGAWASPAERRPRRGAARWRAQRGGELPRRKAARTRPHASTTIHTPDRSQTRYGREALLHRSRHDGESLRPSRRHLPHPGLWPCRTGGRINLGD